MSTQRLLFVNNYRDFMNWSDCVVGMNVTGRALYLFMKNEVEKEEGIKPLLEDVPLLFVHNHMREVGDKTYTIRRSSCHCTKCKLLFNMIEQKFIQQNNPIYIEHPNAAGDPVPILLRMCLNGKGQCTKKIVDGDLKTLCKVMERCPLFEPPTIIEQIIVDRNALMHSSSNELSCSLKEKYLTTVETLLRACNTAVVDKALKEIADLKSYKYLTDDSFTEIKRSITTQIKAIENDQRELERQGCKVPKILDEVLKMVKKNKVTVADANRIKQSREATLAEATVVGSAEGAQALGNGGFVGACLGSVTGGAGAYAAGFVKRGLDAVKK